MSDLPTPAAARLSRARWLDTRLVLGLLLVLLSVVVGAKIFAEADERVRVWAVSRDLGVDTTLSDDDLVVRSVRLDAAARRYVSADQALAGLVLSRPVGRDELLPLAAVRDPGSPDRRRVAIEVDRVGVPGLDKGRVVDVYTVRDTGSGERPAEPELVLAGVTVAEKAGTGGAAFGGSGPKAGVTLLVDASEVPRLISAVAHGTVYVVQVPGSGEGADRAGPS